MYNIKLDDENYFTGAYSVIGVIEGGINIPTLPPTTNLTKALFYKWVFDEWIFDEGKYQEYLNEEETRIPEPTQEEIIRYLEEQNELLRGCIMELAGEVFA